MVLWYEYPTQVRYKLNDVMHWGIAFHEDIIDAATGRPHWTGDLLEGLDGPAADDVVIEYGEWNDLSDLFY